MRRRTIGSLVIGMVLLVAAEVTAQTDPLPSWNDGPTKQAIVEFVRVTTDQGSPKFVPPEARIATFDNDGTLWVEQPIYTQVVFAIDRVVALAPKHPEWKDAGALQGHPEPRPRGDGEVHRSRTSRRSSRRHTAA